MPPAKKSKKKKAKKDEKDDEEESKELLLTDVSDSDSEGELLLGETQPELLEVETEETDLLLSDADIKYPGDIVLGTSETPEPEEGELLKSPDGVELLTSTHLTAPIEQETEIKEEIITERRAEEVLIAFDGNLNERGKISDSYRALKNFMEKNSVKCANYTNVFKQINMAEYDCLIFACPDASRMNKFEINEITRFVESGGSLLLLSHAGGDRGRATNLNDLSQNFGIQFINDQVFDEVHNIGLNSLPIIDDFADHPILKNIKDICYRAGCSIEVTGNARIIADADSIAEPTNAGCCAFATLKLGRVVALGSYEMFRNQIPGGIIYDSHKRLFLNIIDWLTEKKYETRLIQSIERFRLALQRYQDKLRIGKAIRRERKKSTFKLPVLAAKPTAGIEDVDGIIFAFKELSGYFEDLKEEVQDNLKEINSIVKGISMGTVREMEKLKEEFINYKEDRKDSDEAMNSLCMEIGKEVEKLDKKMDKLIKMFKEGK